MTNNYFIYLIHEKQFIPVKGKKITLKDYEEYDMFIHRNANGLKYWTISEGKTGLKIICSCKTQKEAMEKTLQRLNKLTKEQKKIAIEYHIKLYGVSPRYQKKGGTI